MRYSCFQLHAKSFFKSLETHFFDWNESKTMSHKTWWIEAELNDIADIEIVNMYSARWIFLTKK